MKDILVKGKPVQSDEPDLEQAVDSETNDETAEETFQPESDDQLIYVMTHHIRRYVKYLPEASDFVSSIPHNPGVDFTSIQPYLQHLRFSQDMAISPRPLTREQYVTALKQINPKLGELFRVTDMKNLLPDMIDVLDDSSFGTLPREFSLILEEEAGSVSRLKRYSQQLIVIPDLQSLSLFMVTGEQFRKFVESYVGDVSQNVYVRFHNDQVNELRSIKRFPDLNPQNLLDFALHTETTDLADMVCEYDALRRMCTDTSPGNINSVLYQALKKANPTLVQ